MGVNRPVWRISKELPDQTGFSDAGWSDQADSLTYVILQRMCRLFQKGQFRRTTYKLTCTQSLFPRDAGPLWRCGEEADTCAAQL